MIRERKFHLITYGVLILIIIILALTRGCGNIKGGNCNADTIKVVDTITVTKEFPIYKPSIVTVTLPSQRIIDSIPYIDSNYCKALAIGYFTQKYYSDTLKYDSGEVYLKQWVSRNSLDSVKAAYKVTIPYIKTIILPYEKPKDKIKVYIKGNLGTNGIGFLGGPELNISGGSFIYCAGVDFSTFSTPIYRVGVGWKIHFGKK